jgi:hypothetical protein
LSKSGGENRHLLHYGRQRYFDLSRSECSGKDNCKGGRLDDGSNVVNDDRQNKVGQQQQKSFFKIELLFDV